jgi:hypothetical protein
MKISGDSDPIHCTLNLTILHVGCHVIEEDCSSCSQDSSFIRNPNWNREVSLHAFTVSRFAPPRVMAVVHGDSAKRELCVTR